MSGALVKAWGRIGIMFRLTEEEVETLRCQEYQKREAVIAEALRTGRASIEGGGYFPGKDGVAVPPEECAEAGLCFERSVDVDPEDEIPIRSLTEIRYYLWNGWDDILLSPDRFDSIEKARTVLEGYMKMYRRQGFYRDKRAEHVPVEIIEGNIIIWPDGYEEVPGNADIKDDSFVYLEVEDKLFRKAI